MTTARKRPTDDLALLKKMEVLHDTTPSFRKTREEAETTNESLLKNLDQFVARFRSYSPMKRNMRYLVALLQTIAEDADQDEHLDNFDLSLLHQAWNLENIENAQTKTGLEEYKKELSEAAVLTTMIPSVDGSELNIFLSHNPILTITFLCYLPEDDRSNLLKKLNSRINRTLSKAIKDLQQKEPRTDNFGQEIHKKLSNLLTILNAPAKPGTDAAEEKTVAAADADLGVLLNLPNDGQSTTVATNGSTPDSLTSGSGAGSENPDEPDLAADLDAAIATITDTTVQDKFKIVKEKILAMKSDSPSERETRDTSLKNTTQFIRGKMSFENYRRYVEKDLGNKPSLGWKIVGAAMMVAAVALMVLSGLAFARLGLLPPTAAAEAIGAVSALGLFATGLALYKYNGSKTAGDMMEAGEKLERTRSPGQ